MKGFTLMEMIVCMVLIVLLSLFAVPFIQNQIVNKKQEINEVNLKMIYAAADLYMDDNEVKNNSKQGDIYCVSLDKLVQNGYIQSEILDYTNGNKIELNKYVQVEFNSYNEYTNHTIVNNCNINGQSYVITYNSNGGVGIMEPTTNEIVSNTFTRENYSFKEWNTKADGTGTKYQPGAVVLSDLTLYAIWYSASYTLGQLVQYNPVLDEACTSGDNCYKWRVITTDDNGSKDTITIQMDHNLINNTGWAPSVNTAGPTTALSALATATSNWNNSLLLNYTYDTTASSNSYGILTCTNGNCVNGSGTTIATNLKARMITGEEVTKIMKTKNSSTNWSLQTTGNSDYYFSSRTNQIGTDYSGTGDNDLAWLVENTSYNDNSAATNNTYGNNNYGYWTMSPTSHEYTDNYDKVWALINNGRFGALCFSEYDYKDNFGVRPVITINKLKLEN